jgi:hypothetical protein
MPVLRPTGRGSEVVTVAPKWCHNGHPLTPPNVKVTFEDVPGEPAEPPAHT